MMTAAFVQSINTRVVMLGWLAAWIAFAMVIGVTRFVTADEPPEARFGSADGLEGALPAAGLSVSVRPVKMSAAETVVRIEVAGRDDLGYRLALTGRVTLVDAAGTEHSVQTAYLDGRTLTFTFPGSASVEPGPAKLRMATLGLTDDPIDVPPGQERVTYVRSSPLAVDISRTGGPVRRTDLASGVTNDRNQGATVTSITQDDDVLVVNGHLDGFARDEIQSLYLGRSQLVLADGSQVPLAGGSSGDGPELRDFTFWFELPKGTSVPTRLDLHMEARVPAAVSQEATEEARLRLDSLASRGIEVLTIPLGR